MCIANAQKFRAMLKSSDSALRCFYFFSGCFRFFVSYYLNMQMASFYKHRMFPLLYVEFVRIYVNIIAPTGHFDLLATEFR